MHLPKFFFLISTLENFTTVWVILQVLTQIRILNSFMFPKEVHSGSINTNGNQCYTFINLGPPLFPQVLNHWIEDYDDPPPQKKRRKEKNYDCKKNSGNLATQEKMFCLQTTSSLKSEFYSIL